MYRLRRLLKNALKGAVPGLIFALLLQLKLPGIPVSQQWNGRTGLNIGLGIALAGAVINLIRSVWPKSTNRFIVVLEYVLGGIAGVIPGLVLYVIGEALRKEISQQLHTWIMVVGIVGMFLGLGIATYLRMRSEERYKAMANYLRSQGYDNQRTVPDTRAYATAMEKVRRQFPQFIYLWEDVEIDIIKMIGWSVSSGVFIKLAEFNDADQQSAQQALTSVITEVELVRSRIEETRQAARRRR